MPDQSSAADEHAILEEITAPLARIPDDAVAIAADPNFPVAFRGYDRIAVDAYVQQVSQLVAELQTTRSPEAAVRRALERVGDQIGGILQRAHETVEQMTTQSRAEAEDRLELARQEAEQVTAAAQQRLKDLDADTDRIWAERQRIVDDARELARQLTGLADSAAGRFPSAEETASTIKDVPDAGTTDDPEAEAAVEPESGAEPEATVEPEPRATDDAEPDAPSPEEEPPATTS
jgi:DivIVA domain-containing protein